MGADDDIRDRRVLLSHREKDLGPRNFAERPYLVVAHDSNDLGEVAHAGVRSPTHDSLADRALAGPELARKRFVDDDDVGRAVSVTVREIPSLDERNPHRFEVAGRHRARVGFGPIGELVRLTLFGSDHAGRDVHTQWERHRQRCRVDFGHRRDALESAIVEHPRGLFRVAVQAQVRAQHDDVFRLEPGVDQLSVADASEHERCPDEEHERDGNLHDDEGVSEREPAKEASRPRRHRLGLQRGDELTAARLQSGREPEHDAAHDRDHKREEKDASVQSEVESDRERERRFERQNRFRRPVRDQKSERAAESRQQHALRQQLARQSPPRRAEREPDRDFALTGRRARERHVGDVGARDQEHETHDRHHHQGDR